jgi:hypothetical protein
VSATTAIRLRSWHVYEDARAAYEEAAGRPPAARRAPLADATVQERGDPLSRLAELYAAAVEAEKSWRDTI